VEAEDADLHEKAMSKVARERIVNMLNGEGDINLVNDNNNTRTVLHHGNLLAFNAHCLDLPGTPKDWVQTPLQIEKGKLEFADVNNPGD
jgi:hypothetical protein